jgi:16S rRNA (guanine(966)-N(2))-methyltransferase RsmD
LKPRVAGHARAGAFAGQVRIIGGAWKRTRLAVADRPGLRPTPDRVRETVFNWLGQDLAGWRCVDAFAGTGALGFEAASRGAAQVVLIERDLALFKQLLVQKTRLQASQVRIELGDGVSFLRSCESASQDLVFLDPPFDADSLAAALPLAAAAIGADGLIYLEAPRQWPAEDLVALGLVQHRYGKAGMVHFHLLKKTAKA